MDLAHKLRVVLKVAFGLIMPGLSYGVSCGAEMARTGFQGNPLDILIRIPPICLEAALLVGIPFGKLAASGLYGAPIPSDIAGMLLGLLILVVCIAIALRTQSFFWPIIIFFFFAGVPIYIAGENIFLFSIVGASICRLAPWIILGMVCYRILHDDF